MKRWEEKEEQKADSNSHQNVAIFFGCKPGDKSSPNMIPGIVDKFVEKYEKDSFSVLFPNVLAGMQGKDFEVILSNSLQPVRLFYEHNVAKQTIGAIFVHKDQNDREYPGYI